MAQSNNQTIELKRRPGRPAKIDELSPETIFAIRYSYLTDPNATMAGLAKAFKLGTWIIAQLLSGSEYEAIREQIHKTTTQAVRDRLQAASELAAEKWVEAFTPASKKGDHRPMRDLLQANRVIDVTQGITPPVIIQIGVQSESVTLSATPVTPLLPSTTTPPPDTTPPLPPTTPDSASTGIPPVASPPASVPASTPPGKGGKGRPRKGTGK